jgi:hypothetical protein
MATTARVPAIKSSSPELVAPRWHAVVLVALFLALTLGAAGASRDSAPRRGQFEANFLITPLPAFPRHSCSNPFFQPFKLSFTRICRVRAAPASDVSC